MPLDPRTAAGLAGLIFLGACGGGSDGAGETVPPSPTGPTLAERRAAADATARSAGNACGAIGPFWWEIGDRDGPAGSGAVARAGQPAVARETPMAIASASKWLYAIGVAEARGGVLGPQDLPFLQLTSGHTSFDFCRTTASGTVAACAAAGTNARRVAAAEGRFFYGGSHMQQHAAANGLGALDAAGLGAEMRRRLGGSIARLTYDRPWVAGGATTTPADYAGVLQGVVSGRLAMRGLLGRDAVCIDPASCATALFSPITGEGGSYAAGHFVENGPGGDGAFSSAGAYGFYPWIDAAARWYGVVAREVPGAEEASGEASMRCGRLLRAAWETGVAR